MAAKSTTYTVELQAVRLIPAVLGLERQLVVEVIIRTPRLLSTSRRKHPSAAVTLNAPQGAYVTWTQSKTARTYVRLRVLPEGRKAAAPVAAASSSSGLPGAPTVIDTCKSTVAPLKLDEVDGVGQMRTLVVQLDRRAGLADEEDMESGQQKQQGEGSAKEGAAPDADGPDSPLVIAEFDVVIRAGRGGRVGGGSTATAAPGAASTAPGSLSSGMTTAQAWAAMRAPNLSLPGQDPHGAVPMSPAGPPQPTPGSARKRSWLAALGLGLGRGSGGGAGPPTGTDAAGSGGLRASPTPMDCTSPVAASGGGASYAAPGGGGSLLMPMAFPSSTPGAQSHGIGAFGLAAAPGLRASGGLDLAAGPVGSRPTSASRRSGGSPVTLVPREGGQPAMDAAAARMHVPGYAPTGGGAAPGDAAAGAALPPARGKGPCNALEPSPFALESMEPGTGGAAAATAGPSLQGAPSLPSDPSSAPQHCASLADQPPKRRRLLGGLFARLFNSGPSRRLFSPSSAAAADSANSSSTSTALASAAAAALAATGSGTAAAGTPRYGRDTATHGSAAAPVGGSGRTTPTPVPSNSSHLIRTSAGAPSGAVASTAPYAPALPRLSNGSPSTSLGRQRSLNAPPLLVPPSPRLGDVYRIPDNAAWAAASSPSAADPRGVGLNVGGIGGLMGPPAQTPQGQPPAVISRGSGSASNGHLAPASQLEKLSGAMGAAGEPAAGSLAGSGYHGRDSDKDGSSSAALLRGLESPGWGEMSPAAGPDRLLIEPPVDGLAAASLSPPTAAGLMAGVSSPMAVTPAAGHRRLGPSASAAVGAAAAAASPVSAAGCFFPLWRSGGARGNSAAPLLDSHMQQQQDQQHKHVGNANEARIAGGGLEQAGTAAAPAVRSGSGLGSRSFLGLGRGLRRAKDSARESGAGGDSQTPKAAPDHQSLIVEGRGLGIGSGRLSTPAAAAGTGGGAPASGGIGRGGSSGGGAAASGSSAAAAAAAAAAAPGAGPGPATASPEPQAHPLEAEVRRVMAYVQGQRDIPEELRAASVSQCQFLLDCLRSPDTCWLVGDSLLQLKHEVGFPFDSGVPIPGCHDWFRLVLQPTDLGVAVAMPSPAPAPAPAPGALMSSSSAGRDTSRAGGAGGPADAAPLAQQQGGTGRQPREWVRCGGAEDSDEDVVVVGERQGQGQAHGGASCLALTVGQTAGARDSGCQAPAARVPPLALTTPGVGVGPVARGPEVLKVRWARIDQRQAGGANACAAIVLEVSLWCLGAVARWRASATLPTSLLGSAHSARRASAGGRDHGGGGPDAYHHQHGRAGLFPPLGRSRSSNDRNEANRRVSSDRGRVPADPRDGGGRLEAMSGGALEQCIRTGTAVWQSLLATSPAARVASSAGDFDLEHMLSLGGYGEKLRLAEYIAASLLDAPTPRPSATAIGLGGGLGHAGRGGGAAGTGGGPEQQRKGGTEVEGLGKQLQASPEGSPNGRRPSMEQQQHQQQRLPPRPPRPQPLQIPGTAHAHPLTHTHSHHQPLPTARSAHACMVGHGGGVPLFSSLVRSLPPGLYVLGFHGHFCTLWLRPGGVVHLIDSLGSRLAVDCPMAFVAEFAELDEFLAFFAARHQVTCHDTAGLCDDITASNMAALIEVHRLELVAERTLG